MITSKRDYKYYLACDKAALGKEKLVFPRPFTDEIWKFERLMRKYEYINNCKTGIVWKAVKQLINIRYKKLSLKLGFSIAINTFGPGLSIGHYGTIIVNSHASIGKNCRILANVTVGATNGSTRCPKIGDNVFIGDGAKIIGDVEIADNIAIGANAVIVKSFLEPQITLGGGLAKKISSKGSAENVILATDMVDKKGND